MTELRIPGSLSSPTIHCSSQPPRLYMQGDSYPENAFDLYQPVLQWLQAHLSAADATLNMELELVYLNTSSVRVMMDVFDLLEEAHREGKQVVVRWYYDPRNERVAELAEEFREDLSLPFEIQPHS
ncbi:MAG: biofilm regulation phosphoprotein SiaC [Xanthomonadales bacterium]|jgi:hypothetical protein|nr:biofilm regulation phosphoprotein SiaC [Xanthomonadales bacterium]